MTKHRRGKVVRTPGGHVDSLDALLAESRSLREQANDDLDREANEFRKMSRHYGRGLGRMDPEERSA